MIAPARAWSSSGDRPNMPPWPDRYCLYTTWPQNARNAERASHGNVARKRYNGSVQGRVVKLGWITGHQKRSPEMKKLACSIVCQYGDRSARSKMTGWCQKITVRVPANQQNAGRGSHRSGTPERVPSRTNGAAT